MVGRSVALLCVLGIFGCEPTANDPSTASDDTTASDDSSTTDDTFALVDTSASDDTLAPVDTSASDDTFAPVDTSASDDTLALDDTSASDDTFALDDTSAGDDTVALDDTVAPDDAMVPGDAVAPDDTFALDDTVASDDAMVPGDTGPSASVPTLFVIDSMELADAIFAMPTIAGCTGMTTLLNGYLSDQFGNDVDGDGVLDVALGLLFRPYNPSLGGGDVDLVDPLCTTSGSCVPDQQIAQLVHTQPPSGSCLAADPGTHISWTSPNTPDAPCFVTEPVFATIDLAGIPLTLKDVQIAGETTGAGIANGLLKGFLTETVADVYLASDVPIFGWGDLAWYLVGSAENPCVGDQRDTHNGESGWWIYLNFTASEFDYTETCGAGGCGCQPDCAASECGADGCGGSCGFCQVGEVCNAGLCESNCQPACGAKVCGDDGCGGSCGDCPASLSCYGGSCGPPGSDCAGPACTPDCSGKACGDDGCGGSCGDCGTGTSCVSGQCGCPASLSPVGCCDGDSHVQLCDGGSWELIDCGSSGCGWSASSGYYFCGNAGVSEPTGAHPLACEVSAVCEPDCGGSACGDDGCGGSCGMCAGDEACQAGTCVGAAQACPILDVPSPIYGAPIWSSAGAEHYMSYAFFGLNTSTLLPEAQGCDGPDYLKFFIYEMGLSWTDPLDDLDFVDLVIDEGTATERSFDILAGQVVYATSASSSTAMDVTFEDLVFVQRPFTLTTALEQGKMCFRVPNATMTIDMYPGTCIPDCTAKFCGNDPVCNLPCGYCNAFQQCNQFGTACVP